LSPSDNILDVFDRELLHTALTDLHGLREIDLASLTIRHDELKLVARQRNLRTLFIDHSRLAVDDLNDLLPLQRLEDLSFRLTPLTGCDLSAVSELPALREFSVCGCWMEDKTLVPIGKATNLRILRIMDCAVGADGLPWLKDLHQLEELRLENTSIGDDALIHLRNMKQLKHLAISGTQMRGENINVWLPELIRLRQLILVSQYLRNDALPSVQWPKSLEKLVLIDPSVDDALLHNLQSLPNLREVRICQGRCSDDAIVQFKKKMSNCQVTVIP
jgi:hypothetical protein